MDERLLTYAERPAPRYTSYPTAPHFSDAVGASAMSDWLADLPMQSALSLYIHVPYCRQLCWYCGCNTYAARRAEPVADFVETLIAEIDLIASSLDARRLTDIHWGGGTPNILSAAEFARVAAHVARRFDIDEAAQHAIELDPRYVDDEKAEAYAKAGVNRVSLGVQTFDARVQQAIGRVQSFETVRDALHLLRRAGIPQVNMDLMYGLPHQTTEDLRESVRQAATLAPDRIALFGYAHVPWFKKRQRLISESTLPNTTERFDQAEAAHHALESLGYVAIGLDHFAKPDDELAVAQRNGKLRRSFQGYVIQEADAIIGVGPSAISTLPQGYAQNAPEPGAWARCVAAGQLASARGHALTHNDRVRGRLIEQIMCDFEGDLAPLGGRSGCADELALLQPMLADGMIELKDDTLLLTDAAHPFCRLIAMAFDAYAQRGVARHSSAV